MHLRFNEADMRNKIGVLLTSTLFRLAFDTEIFSTNLS